MAPRTSTTGALSARTLLVLRLALKCCQVASRKRRRSNDSMPNACTTRQPLSTSSATPFISPMRSWVRYERLLSLRPKNTIGHTTTGAPMNTTIASGRFRVKR